MNRTTRPRSYESLAHAADRTGVSAQTLRRRIACGQLAAYRTGRLIRVNPDDVDRLLVRSPPLGRPSTTPSSDGHGVACTRVPARPHAPSVGPSYPQESTGTRTG